MIWAPLFASSIAHAVGDLRDAVRGRGSPSLPGWLVNATLAGNIAWSLNSQFRRLDRLSVALIAASAASATGAVALAERHARRRAVGLVTAAAATASATNTLLRGNPGHALAAGWGIGGIALKALRQRDRPLAVTATAGALGLAAASATARARRRCGPT